MHALLLPLFKTAAELLVLVPVDKLLLRQGLLEGFHNLLDVFIGVPHGGWDEGLRNPVIIFRRCRGLRQP